MQKTGSPPPTSSTIGTCCSVSEYKSAGHSIGGFSESGKTKSNKNRGMGSFFHSLWPRYGGPLTPIRPQGYREPLPFCK